MTHYEEDLARVHAEAFSTFARDAIAELLPDLCDGPTRTVVDVGCGSGVTTRALLEAGFDALAIEPSAPLLEMARRNAPGARFVQGSAYDVELPPCDAILALGEPLTYHHPEVDGDARLQRFFAEARRALRRDGRLIFDLIVTGEPPLDAHRWTRGSDWFLLYETIEDVPGRRLVRHIETFRRLPNDTYRRRTETHHVRVFDAQGVRAWLEGVGFEVRLSAAYGRAPLPLRRAAFYARARR